MRKAVVIAASGLLALVGAGLGQRAEAVPLVNGNTLTVGDVVFTVQNCVLTVASVGGACSGDLELIPNPSAPVGTYGVKVDRPSSDIFSVPLPGSSGTYDLAFDLDLKAVSSNVTIQSDAVGITGSAAVANLSKVTASEVIKDNASVTIGSGSASLAAPSQTISFVPQTLTTSAKISVHKDIKVQLLGATSPDTLVLNSVTQDFARAPEPASIGVLLFGLAAVAAARRRRLER